MSAWQALLAFWLSLPPAGPYDPPPPTWDGRILRDPVHLGARFHSDGPGDGAITVQVSL